MDEIENQPLPLPKTPEELLKELAIETWPIVHTEDPEYTAYEKHCLVLAKAIKRTYDNCNRMLDQVIAAKLERLYNGKD